MTVIRLKGIKRVKSRGHVYWYHRATRTRLKEAFGTAAFLREVDALDALARGEAEQKARPGTLAALIAAYASSPAFLEEIKPRTRESYRSVFDYLNPPQKDGAPKGMGDVALAEIETPWIVNLRDHVHQTRGHRTATMVKQVLSLLFTWGVERGFMKANPARGVKAAKRPKNAPRANRPWADGERFAVLAAAPHHLRVPIALAMYTGLREGDVLRLKKTDSDGSFIASIASKSDSPTRIGVIPQLRAILEAAPPHNAPTIAANSRGESWTEDGFRGSWRRFRTGLEAKGAIGKGLTIHGLRHTYGTILAEEDFSMEDIQHALTHESTAMTRHYTKTANRIKASGRIKEGLEAAETRRRKIRQPTGASHGA